MKIPALALSFALAGTSLSPPGTPPSPAPEPALLDEQAASPVEDIAPANEPAQAPRPALTPTLQVHETLARVPSDLKLVVRADKTSGWSLTLRRAKHLVALRRIDQRTAGEGSASLKVALGEEEAAPLVWETTGLDSLVTTRGTVHVDRGGHATLRLAEPPRVTGEIEKRRLHTCQSQDDGFGGLTVLCKVSSWVSAGNLSAADASENVWMARPEGGAKLVRFDFPASGPGVTAMMLGYTDGINGVVVRAEQTFLPGEARPSLTLLSDDRRQPILPRPVRWHEHFDPIDLL